MKKIGFKFAIVVLLMAVLGIGGLAYQNTSISKVSSQSQSLLSGEVDNLTTNTVKNSHHSTLPKPLPHPDPASHSPYTHVQPTTIFALSTLGCSPWGSKMLDTLSN